MTKLLNTLKNKRRLELLGIISKERSSTTRLQHELKELGFNHSQQTIVEEYINPLIEAGLAQEEHNFYCATLFGYRLSELTTGFSEFGDLLPPHSECHEEIALDFLTSGPKTYEDLETVIPAKGVGRILTRLQDAELADRNQEKEHIFFYTTKRNPTLEVFSGTERRIYDSIDGNGISAGKLAQKANISLRRTYRYLRRLKGKKLIFMREKPTAYFLTEKGAQLAKMLRALRSLADEVLRTAAFLTEEKEIDEPLIANIRPTRKKRREENMVSLTPIPSMEHN
jgi:predicted transcriptional regulator